MRGVGADDDAISYRPVSMLAVAAAVAGVASSLALSSPMLWALPLVGAGLAVAGLADVSRAGAEKAGRGLALAGLALSIGFGVQAVTANVVSRWITEARVRSVTHAWLDAIREGNLEAAESVLAPEVLERARPRRPHHGHDHAAHEPEPAAILAVPAVAAIRECGAAARRDLRSTGPDEEKQESWGAVLRLSPCGGGRTIDIRLQLSPGLINEGRGRVERWVITKIEVVPRATADPEPAKLLDP